MRIDVFYEDEKGRIPFRDLFEDETEASKIDYFADELSKSITSYADLFRNGAKITFKGGIGEDWFQMIVYLDEDEKGEDKLVFVGTRN